MTDEGQTFVNLPDYELKRLMRQRVAEGELGDALIELVIRRLKDQRYLNDTDYAASYSSLRRDNEKFGRMRVITEPTESQPRESSSVTMAIDSVSSPMPP